VVRIYKYIDDVEFNSIMCSLGQVPPVTVTGVAPWAVTMSFQSANTHAGRDRLTTIIQSRPNLGPISMPTTGISSSIDSSSSAEQSKREILEDFIFKCMPVTEEDKYRGTDIDWRVQQAALTPTLLPSLKFHDLVFGK
jgi:hypothetical protein